MKSKNNACEVYCANATFTSKWRYRAFGMVAPETSVIRDAKQFGCSSVIIPSLVRWYELTRISIDARSRSAVRKRCRDKPVNLLLRIYVSSSTRNSIRIINHLTLNTMDFFIKDTNAYLCFYLFVLWSDLESSRMCRWNKIPIPPSGTCSSVYHVCFKWTVYSLVLTSNATIAQPLRLNILF